jgi:hypothetical protein
MKRTGFIIIALLIFTSQSKAQHKYYFPLGKPNNHSLLDTFSVKWYSEQLEALNEPIIFLDKSNKEIYRFTWLRSFDHPVMIRIEKDNGQYLIFWKEGTGAGGYKPQKQFSSNQRKIDKTIWNEFISRLNKINFWGIDTKETGLFGTDGSEWILEGKVLNKYHVTDRWTPNVKTDYYKCCDYLIGLTNLKISAGRKY